MSMDKGLMVQSDPKIRIVRKFSFLFIYARSKSISLKVFVQNKGYFGIVRRLPPGVMDQNMKLLINGDFFGNPVNNSFPGCWLFPSDHFIFQRFL